MPGMRRTGNTEKGRPVPDQQMVRLSRRDGKTGQPAQIQVN